MSTVLEVLRKGKSKTTALVAIVAAAIVIPASLYAWGPTRTTYTIEQPADHVTFNSITNNPNIGDERNFVGIREASAPNLWHDEMHVEPGKEYIVRMYVHNNAADNLNLVAENTTAHITLPTTTGRSVQIDGAVSASNATPGRVHDHATFVSDQDFNVAYIPGTLKYETNMGTFDIPETVFDQRGALLGYDKLDGKIPGCFEYAGYLSFRIKPQFAETINFDVSKKVSKHGENNWKDSYAATPGEKVDYMIQYKNTGTAQQDDVVIKDALPEAMDYVAGSTKFGTSAKPEGQQASDNITTTGINIGSYAPNAGTWAMFSATVPSKDELECGHNILKNVATIETDGGKKEDDADVTVDIECEEPPVKKTIEVCELETNKIITIREDQFDENRHTTDLSQCGNMIVCDIETGKTITIGKNEFDESRHTTDLSKCDAPEVPVTPVTPTELPKTGISNGTVTMAGIALVALIAGYAATARRAIG